MSIDLKTIQVNNKIKFNIHEGDFFSKITLQNHVIFEDILQEGLLNLRNSLLKTVDISNTELDCEFDVGYLWNEYAIQMDDDIFDEDLKFELFKEIWLWSYENIETWLYKLKDEIHLIVTPSYRWLLEEPEESDLIESFESFMKDYKPLLIVKLSEVEVNEIVQRCNEIIKSLN